MTSSRMTSRSDVPRPPTPALEAWHRRLRSGRLGEDPGRCNTWRRDALWRAACGEQAALEAWRDGMTAETIAMHLDRAEQALAGMKVA